MLEENVLIPFLKKFDEYPFLVRMDEKDYQIGEGTPTFTVNFRKMIPMKELMKSTSLALGEAYMNGDLEIEGDIYQALDHFLGQMGKFSTDEGALKKLMFSATTKKNQKKEVSSHYDIGNDFYKLWLDETMSYSCGYFCHDDDTLLQAQENKVDYILKKLYLQEGMTLLDIGCGWGYLLIEAAKKYGVKGYGCTLSHEQWEMGQERIKALGLEGQVQIDLLDYRDLPKKGMTFDRAVSVGMLEHVGRSQYERYMSVVEQVLKDKGLFLLHFISGRDKVNSNPWMRKYIFPGGTLPTMYEMLEIAYKGQFQLLDVESLRRHYYKTLSCWYHNFQKARGQVEAKMGSEFVRMWDLYLCGCAAAFYIGYIDVDQMLFTKGTNNDLPMTRWY